MPAADRVSTKYTDTPLRQAQRELTRGRIRDAARDLFLRHHYDSTTMDQIAVAAGLRRSTLYLHYKDKAEILNDIIADYTPRAREMMMRAPGPDPTLGQLDRWIQDTLKFFEREKVPLSILHDVGRYKPNSPSQAAVGQLMTEILSGLGTNIPVFRAAAEPGGLDPLIRAHGEVLVNQLTFACNSTLYGDDPVHAKALRRITAEAFHAFILAAKRGTLSSRRDDGAQDRISPIAAGPAVDAPS